MGVDRFFTLALDPRLSLCLEPFLKHRLVHLDCLRGVAALLVCLEHLRAFLFVPFARLKGPLAATKLFYLLTGLGHQAVMIFFVLSGFLVGGSVITAFQSGKWSWKQYLLRRMSRLWVVLIPALLLTLCWDKLGYGFNPEGYHGSYRLLYNSGPALNSPTDLSFSTFLGNTCFLQTILVPCFGTNGPLWSLANEFWYYLLFPLLLSLFAPLKWLTRLLCFLLLAGILCFLPKSILVGGVIWFLGAIVFFLIRRDNIRRVVSHPLWLVTGFILSAGCLLASRSGHMGDGIDLAIGVGFATLVAGLATRPSSNHIYGLLSAGISEMSYTLYLVHFPALAFLFFVFFQGRQLIPGFASTGSFLLIFLAVIAYAISVWYLFERNTDRIRKFVETRFFF